MAIFGKKKATQEYRVTRLSTGTTFTLKANSTDDACEWIADTFYIEHYDLIAEAV